MSQRNYRPNYSYKKGVGSHVRSGQPSSNLPKPGMISGMRSLLEVGAFSKVGDIPSIRTGRGGSRSYFAPQIAPSVVGERRTPSRSTLNRAGGAATERGSHRGPIYGRNTARSANRSTDTHSFAAQLLNGQGPILGFVRDLLNRR